VKRAWDRRFSGSHAWQAVSARITFVDQILSFTMQSPACAACSEKPVRQSTQGSIQTHGFALHTLRLVDRLEACAARATDFSIRGGGRSRHILRLVQRRVGFVGPIVGFSIQTLPFVRWIASSAQRAMSCSIVSRSLAR
jgi:hypothetical protein